MDLRSTKLKLKFSSRFCALPHDFSKSRNMMKDGLWLSRRGSGRRDEIAKRSGSNEAGVFGHVIKFPTLPCVLELGA